MRLQGLYTEFITHGIKWTNVKAGISHITLHPMGSCTCGYSDVPENVDPIEYFDAGC